jgi:hypothetical protein
LIVDSWFLGSTNNYLFATISFLPMPAAAAESFFGCISDFRYGQFDMKVCRIASAILLASSSQPLYSARADFLPIYGGPAFDRGTRTGYLFPYLDFLFGTTAGSGTGVGAVDLIENGRDRGQRAVRWDTSGVTELGHLGLDISGKTGTSNAAFAVNKLGTAVGRTEKFVAQVFKGPRAVRWDTGSTAAIELDVLSTDGNGGSGSTAYAMNEAGAAVGFATKYEAGVYKGPRAAHWDALGTGVTELGNLGTDSSGLANGFAHAINNAGTAVGAVEKYVDGINQGFRAVRWDTSGAATELGNLGGGTNAYAINDAGLTVGNAYKRDDAGNDRGLRAVRWDASGTAATELGHLGTNSDGITTIGATAVNNAGTAAGSGEKYVDGNYVGYRAVRWDASGTAATELGHLGTDDNGFTFTEAYDIADSGITVGYVWDYDSQGIYTGLGAVMWGADGAAIDLNTLIDPASGWKLLYVRDISDDNWITGVGEYDADGLGGEFGYDRLFLMQLPVPEPAVAVLLAAGIAVLTWRWCGRP